MPFSLVFCFWEGGKPLFDDDDTCLAELDEINLGSGCPAFNVAVIQFGFNTYNI